MRRLSICLMFAPSLLLRAEPAPLLLSRPPAAQESTQPPTVTLTVPEPSVPEPARPVETVLEMQVELHRRGFSCGSIDGLPGAQTAAALRAFQREAGIHESGLLDDETKAVLPLTTPALQEHVFSEEELKALQPLPDTWLGKSQVESLGYATALERVAERYRASPKLLQQLNPTVDWDAVTSGVRLQVPAVEQVTLEKAVARILIYLEARELELIAEDGSILAHFPVSIARMVEKRPAGELRVKVIVPDPNYTFDPAVFPESAEAKELGHKLILPPGPNNPVGVAWIGLDRPGYGIHGTPIPEQVGRTESHGCFRLANWDALTLLRAARVGLPVIVEK